MTESKETEITEIEKIKVELEQVKLLRDQYKSAYESEVTENSNLWGMYSNLVDYVASHTIRKQGK